MDELLDRYLSRIDAAEREPSPAEIAAYLDGIHQAEIGLRKHDDEGELYND